MKAIISDSDNVITNTWYLLTKTFLKLRKKYKTKIIAMSRKYGVMDASAPGTIEFTPENLREGYYREFINEMKKNIEKSEKIIRSKNLEALKKLKKHKIPLIIYTGNHQTVAESYFEKYGGLEKLGIKSVHGYREEDFRRDVGNGFSDPFNKEKIFDRLFIEEELDPKNVILIEDGKRATINAKEKGVKNIKGISTVGIPETNILVPLPKIFYYTFDDIIKYNWSFDRAINEIIKNEIF